MKMMLVAKCTVFKDSYNQKSFADDELEFLDSLIRFEGDVDSVNELVDLFLVEHPECKHWEMTIDVVH